jgi:DNA transformation protein and related proteins
MSTKQVTIDFFLDQLSLLDGVRARKMFGEYAVYYNEKVVALVCDDQLFVKITTSGKEFVGDKYEEGFAYQGAKPSMLIGEEIFYDKKILCELIRITADALPAPKKKK